MNNKNYSISIIAVLCLILLFYDYKQADEHVINNFYKTIIAGLCLGYLLYTSYNYLTIYNKIELNKTLDIEEEFINKQKNRHVSFNDNVDILNFSNDKPYCSRDDIVDNSIDDMMDNLLKDDPAFTNKKKNQTYIPITETDTDQLFNELEEQVKKQYSSLEKNGIFNEVEVPLNPTILRSTNNLKNSDINPAITPDIYSNSNIPEDTTIWEHYDNMTTNNYKQFNSLENTEPNEISDAYRLDNNNKYGMSNFDTFSLN